MNVSDALKSSLAELTRSGIETPLLDAEVILGHVLGTDRYRLVVDKERILTDNECALFTGMIKRRGDGEPVAYITGIKEFYSLDFIVNRHVLIPRPETELLVDLALYYAGMNETVLDLGTGSGAVAVSVKYSRRDLGVFASDVSAGALAVARKNAKALLGDKSIIFYRGDLFHPFAGMKFNVIVSNPPYIDRGVTSELQKELFYEPEAALFAENRGRDIIQKIILSAREYLEDDGHLILEIGSDMKEFVMHDGARAGFSVSVLNDYAGLPRVAHFR
ncbi:MAG TPA: peptide chain release factor N(5)-glutamine methyltransferase [Spirochaetota bacterium]|nr:peptide chain release factor N(5)-glutamine methyltransferase [Spirochaetota bacterium]HPI90252.1 peptide chain release factor N(5)-glutamine methyltransferase [Spirochaetota bacterium]HPR46507.1 peptide chain release factor N(5)-glutamine methyltransferase [Spirochaetota bacterium]